MSAPETLRAYRFVKKKWAASAFDGEGAKRHGGRWNSRGRRCVYLAGSESLAILEIMVHLDDHRMLQHYALIALTLPVSGIMRLDVAALPSNWRDEPAPAETAAIGDEWLESLTSPVLAVPSVVVPRETNYLLNPAHPDAETVIQSAEALEFTADTRL